MNNVSVLTMVTFDYEMLLESLPTYIDLVDEVIIGIDRQRLTWSGTKIDIPGSFFSNLKNLDRDSKIKFVEDDFHVAGLDILASDTRERNTLSQNASEGNWLLSIDADEVIANISETVQYLRNYDETRVLIFGTWLTVYKQIDDKLFFVENDFDSLERFPLATKSQNSFTLLRHTAQNLAFAPIVTIHRHWAREKKQLEWKLRDTSGASQTEPILALWDALTPENYSTYTNFHPFKASDWQKLRMVSVAELPAYIKEKAESTEKSLAWQGVANQAMLRIFESKVATRDLNTARMKEDYEKQIAELKAAYEKKLFEQVRMTKEMKMQLDAELLANKARRQSST